jgi:DNA-directed RNA polymerase specialized sigma24 family protein
MGDIVTSVGGDPDPVGRLAAAFSAYGDLVHDQVSWRLRAAGPAPSPNEVADLVRDTFMIAFAAPLWPRAEQTRPWLLALARNECLRALQTPHRTPWATAAPPAPAADLGDGATCARARTAGRHPGGGLSERDLRTTVRWAAEGLGRREREILELGLRHGLPAEEVGRVTGTGAAAAGQVLNQLGTEFTRVLSTLLLARSGVGSCGRLSDMTSRWNGLPNAERRRRFLRHADACATCDAERAERVDAVGVLRLAPLARAPGEVERWILADATDVRLAAARAALAERAGPFDAEGFPIPLDAESPMRLSTHIGPARSGALRLAVRG